MRPTSLWWSRTAEGHDIVSREDRGHVRVFVEQLPGQFRTTGKIEFPVKNNGPNRIRRRLQRANETTRTVAQVAVRARAGKMGDFPVAELEEILGRQSASRLVVGADRGKSLVRP